MPGLTTAARKARGWLQAEAPSKATASLRGLGLWLCDRIQRPEIDERTDARRGSPKLPSPAAILDLDRRELVDLAQAISLSPAASGADRIVDRQSWARVLGGTALSFARVGDVVAVAALVRAAARLRLHGPWLSDAQTWLLDQQQPDGSFGLLAPELALLPSARRRDDRAFRARLALRVTAETLWALAEVAEEQLHRSRRGGRLASFRKRSRSRVRRAAG